MTPPGTGLLPSSLGTTAEESRVLEHRGEEMIGYAIATLIDTFSRKRALKRIAAFGLSHATAEAFLCHIERDASVRKELADRSLGRAKIAAAGCVIAVGLAFVPSLPKIYLSVIAIGAVHCAFSLIAWKRYSRMPQ